MGKGKMQEGDQYFFCLAQTVLLQHNRPVRTLHTFTHTYTHLYTCTCALIHIYKYTYTKYLLHIFTNRYIYIYIFSYTHTYTYIHTNISKHIYTHSLVFSHSIIWSRLSFNHWTLSHSSEYLILLLFHSVSLCTLVWEVSIPLPSGSLLLSLAVSHPCPDSIKASSSFLQCVCQSV